MSRLWPSGWISEHRARALVLLRRTPHLLAGGRELFSSWREEDETNWRENAAHIERYREVDGYEVSLALLRRVRATRELDEDDCDH